MQTRHSHTNFGLPLPLQLIIWQQIMIWGSLLFSSPAWSMPKTTALPSPAAHAHPVAAQVAIADVSSPSLSERRQASVSLPSQRYQAAALLPLQPLQAETVANLSDAFFSTPSADLTVINTTVVPAIAQSISPAAAPDNRSSPPAISDPELGVLRLQPPQPSPSTEGGLFGQNQTNPTRPKCASGAEPDPELGCLPLQPLQPPPPQRQPFVYLLGHVDYFRSSNVFSAVDPVDDGLVRPGLTLFTAPALGRNTYFVASVDVNLIRYNTQSQIDYNELRFRAGIFQRLSPTMFGELGWSNQQLFITGSKIPGLPEGTRFLNDHAIRLELSRRDQLNKRLSLSTFYQLRLSFADPDNRSRLLNSLIASLSYDIQSNLQVGVDYQFALANFTAVNRDDQYHQLAARLTYTAFRNTQLNLFVGYSFGSSSDPLIDFNSLILGVSLTVNVGLF